MLQACKNSSDPRNLAIIRCQHVCNTLQTPLMAQLARHGSIAGTLCKSAGDSPRLSGVNTYLGIAGGSKAAVYQSQTALSFHWPPTLTRLRLQQLQLLQPARGQMQDKHLQRQPAGKLVPLPVPEASWDCVTADRIPAKDKARLHCHSSRGRQAHQNDPLHAMQKCVHRS